MAKKTLPLVAMKINPEKGTFVSAIAIVGRPAIGSNFIAFSQDEPTGLQFAADDEKMELIGAAMIPGLPMYRNTKGIGEYMSVFDAETIREIAQLFAARGYMNNMNIGHTDKNAGAYVFQSYIVDTAKGINAPTGIEAPDGSWIVGVKVNDPETWLGIKSGQSNGFSVEGIFDLFETDINMAIYMSADADELAIAQEFADALASAPTGCLMFIPQIDLNQWQLQAIKIAPGAISTESNPHITIIAGLLDDPTIIPVLKEFMADALAVYPLDLDLGSISKFTNPDADVIKIDVCDRNGALSAINTILAEIFAVVSPFGDYQPHMTIAYTAPDPSVQFSSDPVWPWEFGINYLNKGRIVYSDAQQNLTELLIIK